MTVRRTKRGIDITKATPAELKEVGAPYFLPWDCEAAKVLGITPRKGPGYFYLDRTLDDVAIQRLQLFSVMPPAGAA
jgi:hypothetical protein